ncbi:MAG: hypothetical protein JKY48_05035 [Flavobacteriales bacterium]|nr:hypothetical protein [Flavobacteriales bacterium]
MVNRGLLILEKGKTFGPGDLVYYGINSNTSAAGFLKAIYRKDDSYQRQAQSKVSLSS